MSSLWHGVWCAPWLLTLSRRWAVVLGCDGHLGSDDAEMLFFLTAGLRGSNTASHVMFPRTGHARFPLINKTVKDMTSISSDKTCVKSPVGQTRHKPEKKVFPVPKQKHQRIYAGKNDLNLVPISWYQTFSHSQKPWTKTLRLPIPLILSQHPLYYKIKLNLSLHQPHFNNYVTMWMEFY